MAQVIREDIDDLNISLNVSIGPDDYKRKFTEEMDKYRRKSHMKGFRKGKTPLALIKKMYGKAVLADVINETIQRKLFAYMDEEKIKYLGQPLPADGEIIEDFDFNNLGEYKLKFDLGLSPEYTIKGIDSSDIYEKIKVEIPKEDVDKDMEAMQKRAGKNEPVEAPIELKDLIKIEAEELEDGKVKENGWATTFTIFVDENLNPEFSKDLLGKKNGDVLEFQISQIEKDRSEEYVRKYLLQVPDADADTVIGDDFTGKIIEVGRVQPAEMNQEFFDKVFGEGNVSSEEEARNKIKEQIEGYYNSSAEQLLYRDIQKNILDSTEIAMPDKFLERWLAVANDLTPEQAAKDYKSFAKGLRWTLVRRDLMEKFELKVEEEELLDGFKSRVRQYFGGYGDELVILNTANRLMEDKEQTENMYQELATSKLFKKLAETISVNEKSMSKEDFEAKVKEIQAADNADIQASSTEVAEEVE